MDLATQTHLASLRELLTFRLHELETEVHAAELASRESGATTREVRDLEDEAAQRTLSDIGGAEQQRDIDELRQVQAALHRLDSGVYGDCIDCGQPIALDRLRVLAHLGTEERGGLLGRHQRDGIALGRHGSLDLGRGKRLGQRPVDAPDLFLRQPGRRHGREPAGHVVVRQPLLAQRRNVRNRRIAFAAALADRHQRAAVDAMARVGLPIVVRLLYGAAEHEHKLTRAAGILKALEAIHSEEAIGVLLLLASQHSDPPIKFRATQSLLRLGSARTKRRREGRPRSSAHATTRAGGGQSEGVMLSAIQGPGSRPCRSKIS